MNKKCIFFTLFLLISFTGIFSQNNDGYVPYTFSKSYLETAIEQLKSKNYNEAIKYFNMWLEAYPKDYEALYDLSCAYALKGDRENALITLQKAVDAGWLDPEWILNDKDLGLIKNEEKFKAIIDRCRLNLNESGPKDLIRHYKTMTSLGTYIVMLPPDYGKSGKKYPLCIVIHGHGGIETKIGKTMESAGREDVIYVVTRAPYPVTEYIKYYKMECYSGRPDYKIPDDYNIKVLKMYTDWIMSCADEVKKNYRVSGDRYYVFGHSQGAATAIAMAFFYPEKVYSFLAYAGFIIKDIKDDKYVKNMMSKNVNANIMHCENDLIVPIRSAYETNEFFKKNGMEVNFIKIPEGSHKITEEVSAQIKIWIDKEIRKIKL